MWRPQPTRISDSLMISIQIIIIPAYPTCLYYIRLAKKKLNEKVFDADKRARNELEHQHDENQYP